MLDIGLIQLRAPASQSAALDHAGPLIRQAAAAGASLVVTPEGSNILQRDRAKLLKALAPMGTDAAVTGFRALAAELSIWLLVGSALVEREDGKAANRSILIAPDGVVAATYDKIHMFDVDLPTGERHRESSSYEAGSRAVVAQAGDAKLGLTVCYDLRFPALHWALARAGAQLITVPSAFTRPTGAAHWEILLRARAIETGSFVLAAAQGGTHEDGRATWGRSMVVGPWGDIIALADHDEPGVVLASLDLSEVDKARRAIPTVDHARAFTGP